MLKVKIAGALAVTAIVMAGCTPPPLRSGGIIWEQRSTTGTSTFETRGSTTSAFTGDEPPLATRYFETRIGAADSGPTSLVWPRNGTAGRAMSVTVVNRTDATGRRLTVHTGNQDCVFESAIGMFNATEQLALVYPSPDGHWLLASVHHYNPDSGQGDSSLTLHDTTVAGCPGVPVSSNTSYYASNYYAPTWAPDSSAFAFADYAVSGFSVSFNVKSYNVAAASTTVVQALTAPYEYPTLQGWTSAGRLVATLSSNAADNSNPGFQVATSRVVTMNATSAGALTVGTTWTSRFRDRLPVVAGYVVPGTSTLVTSKASASVGVDNQQGQDLVSIDTTQPSLAATVLAPSVVDANGNYSYNVPIGLVP